MSQSIAEAILGHLHKQGVKRIYGVVGDAIFGLLDAIAKQSAIQFVSVKHESVAALMASAEAKLTGELGVCIAQMGPGLANLINGLGDAYLDRCPVLAITGQAPLNKIGTDYKQYIDQQVFVQAVAEYSELVVHPDAVIKSLSRAIHTSLTMETVSHLSIPADVFAMSTSYHPFESNYTIIGEPDNQQLQQALQMMEQAKRPMMLLGDKARQAEKEIQRLAVIWGSGLALGYGATDVMPESAPNLLGGLGEGGNPYLTGRFKEADVVLTIGTSWWPDECTPGNARLIRIDDRMTGLDDGKPMDCGIVGKIASIVSQLAAGLKDYRINPDWIKQIQQCKHNWALQNDKEGNESGFPLHPSRIVRAIKNMALPDAIIALDEGDSTLWFMRHFRVQRQRVLLSNRWRTMGFGMPAAMAAKCCLPDRQVLCVTGDGGFAMVLADMLTAARYNLRINVILFNNGTLQMERNKMTLKGLVPEGTEITNPDYVKLAKACGWDAYRVQAENDLEQALQTSLSGQKPILLDIPAAQVSYPDYPKS